MANQRHNSGPSLSGIVLLSLGVLFLLVLAWHRLTGNQESQGEEIVKTLGELIEVLDRDSLLAGDLALPEPARQRAGTGLAVFRNPAQFWEPAFREADKKMKRDQVQ